MMKKIFLLLLASSALSSLALTKGMAGKAGRLSVGLDTLFSASLPDEAECSDTLAEDTVVADSIDSDYVTPLTTQQRIETLLASDLLQTSQVGFMAYDLTADSVIVAYNENQALRPASTMKLLTAITALDKLGGDYRFSTWLKYRGTVFCNDDDTKALCGDVIVKGGMDPRFGQDDMRAFVEALQKEHIDTVYGTLKADLSFKDAAKYGEGWCWDDKNPVLTPLLWNRKDIFLSRLKEQLTEAGIVITDSVRHGWQGYDEGESVPVRLLCTRHHTIEQVLMRMMKESDNLFAECVFYNISADVARPASAAYTRKVMQETLRRAGVKHSNYRIADGSGLSLYNYQTAAMQVALLRYAYNNNNIFEYLYPTLPIAGVDGTLKRRMQKSPCYGNVRAKTGTLTGISSLSGYLTTRSGSLVAFAIINQGVLRAAPAKAFQDKLCRILCDR